ncbi:hypothetical protein BSKO_04999 [Bryopsis sp. KO-2023]|nr:hypothetical protein BSKO_04999 [Bryopsis sp. KO-2023]
MLLVQIRQQRQQQQQQQQQSKYCKKRSSGNSRAEKGYFSVRKRDLKEIK